MTISPNHRKALRLVIEFISPYRRAVIGALIALVITAGITLGLGQGLRILVDQGLATQSPENLAKAIGLFFVLILGLAFGSFARFYLVSWIGERVVADIRKQVFNHLIDLHPGFFEQNRALENNIRYARPGAEQSEVEQAARIAHADEFIQALPQGYYTPLGVAGLGLSGGQKQRLASLQFRDEAADTDNGRFVCWVRTPYTGNRHS